MLMIMMTDDNCTMVNIIITLLFWYNVFTLLVINKLFEIELRSEKSMNHLLSSQGKLTLSDLPFSCLTLWQLWHELHYFTLLCCSLLKGSDLQNSHAIYGQIVDVMPSEASRSTQAPVGSNKVIACTQNKSYQCLYWYVCMCSCVHVHMCLCGCTVETHLMLSGSHTKNRNLIIWVIMSSFL